MNHTRDALLTTAAVLAGLVLLGVWVRSDGRSGRTVADPGAVSAAAVAEIPERTANDPADDHADDAPERVPIDKHWLRVGVRRTDTGKPALMPGLRVRLWTYSVDESTATAVREAPGRCLSKESFLELLDDAQGKPRGRTERLPRDGRVEVHQGVLGIEVASGDPRVEAPGEWIVHVPTVREFWIPASFHGQAIGSLVRPDGSHVPGIGWTTSATYLADGTDVPVDPDRFFDGLRGEWLPHGEVAVEVASGSQVGMAVLDVPAFEELPFDLITAPLASVRAGSSLVLRIADLTEPVEVTLEPRGVLAPTLWSAHDAPAWRAYVFPEVRFDELFPGRYAVLARPLDDLDATPVEVAWAYLRPGEDGEVSTAWPEETTGG